MPRQTLRQMISELDDVEYIRRAGRYALVRDADSDRPRLVSREIVEHWLDEAAAYQDMYLRRGVE